MKTKILIMVLILSVQGLFADYATWLEEHPNPKIISQDGQNYNTIDDFGNYYAILIYVEDYTHFKKLKTPKNDVIDIAKILEDRYGFKIKILDNPKNADALIKALVEFTNKLTSKDNLLIYYAGHGSEDGYWQLKDADTNGVGWIPVEFAVNKTIKNILAKHIVVISDSCYAGYLTRGEDGNNINNITINDKKYYSKLQQLKSRTVFASGGDEPVADKDPTNPTHSAFASGVIEMLNKNNKAIFSLEEKFFIVKKHVMGVVPNQTPLYKDIKYSGFDDGGDFIFIDRKSVYAHKDRNVLEPKSEITSSSISQKIPKVDNRIDTILVWLLAIVSFLLLILSIIYFRTRKKIPIIDNDTIKEVTPNSSIDKPFKNKIPKSNKGVLTMGTVTYQNQPFTKKYTWQEAKEYAKNLRLGGFDDWRLPSLKELRALGNIELYDGEDDALWNEWYQNNKDNALVNSKGEKHFIHEKLVENMPKESIFWTIESKDEDDIYMVAFNLGCNYVDYSTSMYYILCVRDNK